MNAGLRSSIVTLLVQLTLSLWLLGCAEQPVREASGPTEAGYGEAFGRIEYREDGKETAWDTSGFLGDSLMLFVRAVGTEEVQKVPLQGDGTFYWRLRPGEYVIVGFRIVRRGWGHNPRRTARLMTTFSVPHAGQAFYIGDLRIVTQKNRSRFDVVDRWEGSAKPGAAKALMRLELPPGRFTRVTGICSPSWGLECDRTYQGVRPVLPEGTAWNFAPTKSLTPRLEWQPSSRRDIAYDVAIYESVAFEGIKGLRGTLVAYAEGLREPKYSPAPLEHWRQYEWTVRLRDGDTVSSWSATSYNFFAVVVWGSGSGQYFGFETPRR
jgi:hypothetical protein